MTTKEIDLTQTKTINIPNSWRGKALFVAGPDMIMVKKMQSPDLEEIRRKLKPLAGKISQKEIDKEVRSVRKKKYRTCS